MRREAIYEAWAPEDGVWSLWARPVLFAQMPEDAEETPATADNREPLDLSWVPDTGSDTLLVIDLPGGESIEKGLALAERGYRPVPAYNACTGLAEVIDMTPLLTGLRTGARQLRALSLPPTAPPAFLLDARRTAEGSPPQPGQFNNRWQVFPQDFPSADFLREQGMRRVLVVQRRRRAPQDDLGHVLHRWQDAGFELLERDVAETGPLAPLVVSRPRGYRTLWHRALAILGLRRNPLGGFGGVEPRHG